MTFETDNIPATLRRWLESFPERIALSHESHARGETIYAVSYEGGYATRGQGNAYDILLAAGWSTREGMHTIIEPTLRETLRQLRSTVPCDCSQCQREATA